MTDAPRPAPMTWEEFQGERFFASLTGLRAIAVVMVIFEHYGGSRWHFLTGWLGVHVFFVLSGFLITTLLLRESDARGSVSLRAFYIRRVFRIMPVYYLVFAFEIWQNYRLGGDSWAQMRAAIPYYLVFMNEESGPAPWKITWSLGIEWKYYLVWAPLAFWVVRTPASRLVLSGIVVACLAYFWYTPHLNAYHYMVLMQGSILAMVMHDRRWFRFVRWLLRPDVALAVFVGFIAFQTQVYRLLPRFGDALVANLYALTVVPLIVAILGHGLPRRILSSRPFLFLGDRSYSLYLVQILASQATTGFAPWRELGTAYAFQTVIVGTVISDALYRYVEKPMTALGHRFAAKVRSAAGAISPVGAGR